MANYLRPRRGKAATAKSQNIILKRGEVFFEVPTGGVGTGVGKIKMGDGTTAYSSLPYFMEQTTVDVAASTIAFTASTSTSNTTLLSEIKSGATLKTIIGSIKTLLSNLNTSVTSLNNDLANGGNISYNYTDDGIYLVDSKGTKHLWKYGGLLFDGVLFQSGVFTEDYWADGIDINTTYSAWALISESISGGCINIIETKNDTWNYEYSTNCTLTTAIDCSKYDKLAVSYIMTNNTGLSTIYYSICIKDENNEVQITESSIYDTSKITKTIEFDVSNFKKCYLFIKCTTPQHSTVSYVNKTSILSISKVCLS
jgi:hypothetical protein